MTNDTNKKYLWSASIKELFLTSWPRLIHLWVREKIDFELQYKKWQDAVWNIVKCIHLTEALGLAFTLQVTVALDPVKKIVCHCQHGHCHHCYHNHHCRHDHYCHCGKKRLTNALLSLKSRKLLSSNNWHISQKKNLRLTYIWHSDIISWFWTFYLLFQLIPTWPLPLWREKFKKVQKWNVMHAIKVTKQLHCKTWKQWNHATN